MTRKFRHAQTGQVLAVVDGTRTAALVEADENWIALEPEAKPQAETSTPKGSRSRKR